MLFRSFGVLTDFNALATSRNTAEQTLHAMYSVTNPSNLYGSWMGLVISAVVCVVVFAVALQYNES